MTQNHQQLPARVGEIQEKYFSEQKNFLRELILEKDRTTFLRKTFKLTEELNIQEVSEWFLEDIFLDLDEESKSWVLETILNDDLIEQIGSSMKGLAKILIQKKLILGKDFSIFNNKLLITDAVLNSILAAIPTAQRNEILEDCLVCEELDPIRLGEKSLGVPFFENLVQLTRKRFSNLDDEEIFSYLIQIIPSVARKFKIDDYDLLEWFSGIIKPHCQKNLLIICWSQKDKELKKNAGEWLEDLITAAGGKMTDVVDENGTELRGLDGNCVKLLRCVYEPVLNKISIYDLLPESKTYAFNKLLEKTIEWF